MRFPVFLALIVGCTSGVCLPPQGQFTVFLTPSSDACEVPRRWSMPLDEPSRSSICEVVPASNGCFTAVEVACEPPDAPAYSLTLELDQIDPERLEGVARVDGCGPIQAVAVAEL